jgi:hypothetical protein
MTQPVLEGQSDVTRESAMERFVSHQNIERYRKLADLDTDETQRRLIFDLLAEEQEKFRQTRETLQCPL